MYQALAKSIQNSINSSSAPLEYKASKDVITYDYIWTMMEHLLIHCAPHLCGKYYDTQKQVYDLNTIPGKNPHPSSTGEISSTITSFSPSRIFLEYII